MVNHAPRQRRRCGRLDDAKHAVINALFALAWSINAIAKFVGCDWKTAKRATSSKPPSLRPLPHAPSLSRPQRAKIALRRRRIEYLSQIKETKLGGPPLNYTYVKKKFHSCRLIAEEYLRRFGEAVSRQMVLRDLKAREVHSVSRPQGVQFTVDDAERRCKFSRHLRSEMRRGRLHASSLLFSDEKWANTNDHGLPYEFVRPGEAPTRRCYTKYAASLRMWGLIGVGVKLLIFLPSEQSVTSESYIRNSLSPALSILRRGGKVFMQDGARAHTARATMDWLRANGVKVLGNWPARSPDLNPIETMWAIVQAKVAARMPSDDTELQQYWREEWNAVPQHVVDDLVLSFRGRLERCLAEGGRQIDTRTGLSRERRRSNV